MPPRKRAKLAAATSDSEATSPPAPKTPASPQPRGSASPDPKPDIDTVNDHWTEEQLTALLKGVIRWKPTGIHKHFHMLSIYRSLLSHGFAAPSVAEHTRLVRIWDKLEEMYDLSALDEREDHFRVQEAVENSGDGGMVDEELGIERWFKLPSLDGDDEEEHDENDVSESVHKTFADIIWQHRFKSEDDANDDAAPSSSPELPSEAFYGRRNPPPLRLGENVVSEIESQHQASRKTSARATPVNVPRGRGRPRGSGTRGGRGGARRGGKVASPAASEQSNVEEESEEEEEDDGEEAAESSEQSGEEEEDEEEEEGSSEAEEEEATSKGRGTSSTRGQRGRPRGRGGRAKAVAASSRRSTRKK